MCFRVLVILFLLMSLSISCSRTKTNPKINPSSPEVDSSGPVNGTNVTLLDKDFDVEAFKKEIQKKVAQINLPEEEKRRQALDINNRTMKLRQTTHQQLQELFSNSSLNPEEITDQSIQIIDSIEFEVKKIINDSFISKYFDQDAKNRFIYFIVLEEQGQAQKAAKKLMDEYIESQLDTVVGQMKETQQLAQRHSHDVVDRSRAMTGPHTPQSMFEEEIINPVKESLKDRHNRTELGLLKEPLEKSDSWKPYQFQFADAGLSDEEKEDPLRQPHKFIRLYKRLWHANPFHEQGILARKCGLVAVESADVRMLTEFPREAEISYQFALALEKIALFGVLPGAMERSIYESCTGKDLITGEVLADEDRWALPVDDSYFNNNEEGFQFSTTEIISEMDIIRGKLTFIELEMKMAEENTKDVNKNQEEQGNN